ncbi:MAG: divergent PAP2 family protein [Patescibacteria group bacterium]|nr:divergent PAP2 family protein [Patescibacteria group bacterium]MDD5490528.1 divergent PAP2 family protein [Patescibacteria group bacterium]
MLKELITNPIILSCLFSDLISQAIKAIIYSRKNAGFHWRYLLMAAGMPSTHTAVVTSLTLGIFLYEGITTLFIASLVFSLIVIRDVIGDRVFAQHQEDIVNKIFAKIFHGSFEGIEWKNLIGHNLREVFWGIILGLFITSIIFIIWWS